MAILFFGESLIKPSQIAAIRLLNPGDAHLRDVFLSMPQSRLAHLITVQMCRERAAARFRRSQMWQTGELSNEKYFVQGVIDEFDIAAKAFLTAHRGMDRDGFWYRSVLRKLVSHASHEIHELIDDFGLEINFFSELSLVSDGEDYWLSEGLLLQENRIRAQLERSGERGRTRACKPRPGPELRANNRARVDAYLAEIYEVTGKKLTRTHLWRSQGYNSRTQFERWERNDPRATQQAAEVFERMLREKPYLKTKQA